MAPPRKYSVELQEQATRMALDARQDPGTSRGAIKRVWSQHPTNHYREDKVLTKTGTN